MKILITGATGFIGRPLCLELTRLNHELTLITRDPEPFKEAWGLPSAFVQWDMQTEDCPIDLDPFDAIIHLAGESIAGGLWTGRQKEKILFSRTVTTAALGAAIAKRRHPLPVFITAAAIGIYPTSRTEVFDEGSEAGEGFLSEVCKAWEAAVADLSGVKRKVAFRFGLVLGQGGGFVGKMLLPTRLGIGAVIGDGGQWMSWIHRDDIVRMIAEALQDEAYKGPINAVAPEPVTQKAFQKTLAGLLQRPVFLKIPAQLIKVLLRDFSHLVLDSQAVAPKRLNELGYRYSYPRLSDALAEVLDIHEKDGRTYFCHRLEAVQFIPRPVDEVFEFFCDPGNLERITPPLLRFKVKGVSTPEITEGTIIHYDLKVHGIALKWKTLIKNWKEGELFVDNQESGPYSVWHHTHAFFPVRGGALMTDNVRYRLPMGMLGESLALRLVKRDIKQIFAFRRKMIKNEFAAEP